MSAFHQGWAPAGSQGSLAGAFGDEVLDRGGQGVDESFQVEGVYRREVDDVSTGGNAEEDYSGQFDTVWGVALFGQSIDIQFCVEDRVLHVPEHVGEIAGLAHC